MSFRRTLLVVVAVIAVGGGAYFYMTTPSAPPPAEVATVVVHAGEVPLPLEYAGRVAAFRDVEIRAQVGGVLLKREFNEGDRVEKDQVLFRIDPQPYQVALERAQAQLGQAQATLKQAEENFTRTEQLMQRQVAAQKQLDDAVAARDQARAAVRVAEAEIRTAQLNLGYTVITAPVAGPTRLQSPPEGTLIQAQQTLLTAIQQLDLAYVNSAVTDTEYQTLRQIAENRPQPIKGGDLTFRIAYPDGRTYPETGKLDNSANSVDPQTGTVQIRAVFPNPKGQLLPGQFVRMQVSGLSLLSAIVVPKPAVSQGPQGPFVWLIGQGNVAAARPIRLGRELPTGWVVNEGLADGDQIVVDGVLRVRPGAVVRPVAATASNAPAPGGGPAPSGGGK